ncbi:unnamed protein product, partial [Meganyctiphanes norvegica]
IVVLISCGGRRRLNKIMASYVGLDKLGKALRIVKENGGIRSSLYRLYRLDDLKTGTVIGTDAHGNIYRQNNNYLYGRNRWVEYAPAVGMDYEGSMVPAEWYGWLHYKVDEPPTTKAPTDYSWQSGHEFNVSGTPKAFIPYSTTKPKIEAWVPPKAN